MLNPFETDALTERIRRVVREEMQRAISEALEGLYDGMVNKTDQAAYTAGKIEDFFPEPGQDLRPTRSEVQSADRVLSHPAAPEDVWSYAESILGRAKKYGVREGQ